jgi:enterochelin esterase-like enzyme
VVFLGTALSAATAAETPTRPTTRPQREISWVNPKLPAGQGLSHHVLASKAMGRDVGYVVWLPGGYEDKADQRYPVIYFLHGAGGNESGDSAGFSGYLAEAIKKDVLPPVICVFPNGGMSGYRGEVETMIVKELIPLVDQSYRTIAKPASRAVAGFSMGASGATRLAIAQPGLFCAAAGWGGGPRPGTNPMTDDAAANAEALKKNGVAIMQIKGDKDRPEGNQEFAKVLDKLGIANEIIILKDTDHNLGLYYQRSADQLMKFLAKHIRK